MSENNVILPRHLDPNSFVTAAFDNLDFKDRGISGKESTHDTKIVLFQNYDQKKIPVSEILSSNDRYFGAPLKCQELLKYVKKSNEIKIKNDWECPSNLYNIKIEDYKNVNQKMDLAWLLSRMQIRETNLDVQNEN